MKNYEEMARCVLEARDEHIRRKTKRQAMVKRCVPVVSGLCVAILIGVGVWKNVTRLPDIPTAPEADSIETVTQETKQETKPSAAESDTTEKSSMPETNTETVSTDTALETTVDDSAYTVTENAEVPQEAEEHPAVSESAVTESTVSKPMIGVTGTIPATQTITTDPKTEAPDQGAPSETSLPWAEQEIFQQYFGCDMGNPPVYFQTAMLAVPPEKADAFLGTVMMSGYDFETSTYHYCTAEAYSIAGVSPSEIIAVRFDGFDHYYAYYALSSLSLDAVKGILFPEEEGV